MPTGSKRIPRDVPWASFCVNPRNNTSAGTMMTPPPIPINPLRNPATRPTIPSSTMVVKSICLFYEIRFIKFDGFFHDQEGFGFIAKFFHYHGFVFQSFILFKEVAQFIKEMLGKFFNIVVMIHPGVIGC